MIDVGFTVLLIWHVSSVITWAGSAYFFTLVVSPSLRKMIDVERRTYLRSFFPRFSKVISGASISTLIAGTLLFGYVTTVNSSLDPVGWRLVFIIIGAVLGIVAGFLTLGVMLPLGAKVSKQAPLAGHARTLTSASPTTENMSRVDYTASVGSILSSLAVLLSCVVVLMTLGMFF